MPLYEYRCQSCGCRYERIERVSAPAEGTCPECSGTATRLIGAPALQFKGSGWYVNDYGKGNGSQPTEKEKETATAAASTSTTKSDSKSPKTTDKTVKKADAKVA